MDVWNILRQYDLTSGASNTPLKDLAGNESSICYLTTSGVRESNIVNFGAYSEWTNFSTTAEVIEAHQVGLDNSLQEYVNDRANTLASVLEDYLNDMPLHEWNRGIRWKQNYDIGNTTSQSPHYMLWEYDGDPAVPDYFSPTIRIDNYKINGQSVAPGQIIELYIDDPVEITVSVTMHITTIANERWVLNQDFTSTKTGFSTPHPSAATGLEASLHESPRPLDDDSPYSSRVVPNVLAIPRDDENERVETVFISSNEPDDEDYKPFIGGIPEGDILYDQESQLATVTLRPDTIPGKRNVDAEPELLNLVKVTPSTIVAGQRVVITVEGGDLIDPESGVYQPDYNNDEELWDLFKAPDSALSQVVLTPQSGTLPTGSYSVSRIRSIKDPRTERVTGKLEIDMFFSDTMPFGLYNLTVPSKDGGQILLSQVFNLIKLEFVQVGPDDQPIETSSSPLLPLFNPYPRVFISSPAVGTLNVGSDFLPEVLIEGFVQDSVAIETDGAMEPTLTLNGLEIPLTAAGTGRNLYYRFSGSVKVKELENQIIVEVTNTLGYSSYDRIIINRPEYRGSPPPIMDMDDMPETSEGYTHDPFTLAITLSANPVDSITYTTYDTLSGAAITSGTFTKTLVDDVEIYQDLTNDATMVFYDSALSMEEDDIDVLSISIVFNQQYNGQSFTKSVVETGNSTRILNEANAVVSIAMPDWTSSSLTLNHYRIFNPISTVALTKTSPGVFEDSNFKVTFVNGMGDDAPDSTLVKVEELNATWQPSYLLLSNDENVGILSYSQLEAFNLFETTSIDPDQEVEVVDAADDKKPWPFTGVMRIYSAISLPSTFEAILDFDDGDSEHFNFLSLNFTSEESHYVSGIFSCYSSSFTSKEEPVFDPTLATFEILQGIVTGQFNLAGPGFLENVQIPAWPQTPNK